MKALRITLLAAVVAVLPNLGGWLRPLEEIATDLMMRARGPRPADPRIVVCALDAKSLREFGRWPWRRNRVAALIDRLKADGARVIVTNKKDQSISVIDARVLTETKRLKTTKKIVHGVAYSPDGRYAFISQESIGSDPGAVDVLDLSTLTMSGTFPVPAQPTGITILRLGGRP